MEFSKRKLLRAIDNFRNRKVLVIGDLILDHYIFGSADRLSPEAPVPVVWLRSEKYLLGGASNVANNIKVMGAGVILCGVVGRDIHSEILKRLLKKKRIRPFLIETRRKPTILKTRVIASHQQIVRVDKEDTTPIDGRIIAKITNFMIKNINKFEGIIIEDYGKGLITPELLIRVKEIAKKYKKIVTVDPKEDHFNFYTDLDAITPNKKEAQFGLGMKIKNKGDLDKVGKILSDEFNIKSVLITLGEEGMALYEKEKPPVYIPTKALEVFDVTGAGDTVIALFTLGILSGLNSYESALLANFAAGSVVSKLGVSTATPQELKERIISD